MEMLKKLITLLTFISLNVYSQDSLFVDCDGTPSPENWLGDGFCDDGSYTWNGAPINFNCEEFGYDEGDCEAIDEGCTPGLIEDCNGICAPAGWLGDGFCDDGSYEYNGNPIFFNCEEFNFDNGDCDILGRQTPRVLNKIFIGK